MKKIKLLYIVSSLKKCGPINILKGIIHAMDKSRFEISVITLSRVKKGWAEDSFEEPNIRIYNLNNGRIVGTFINLKKIQAFIDEHKIDICHSNDFRADQINSKLKRVTTTNTIHNFPKEDYLYRYGRIIGQLMEFSHKNTIAKLSHPIACSKSVSDKFLKTYGVTTGFVQNGVNVQDFSTKHEFKQQLKKDLKLPLNKKVFIVSGALTHLKNPQVIIKAFNKLQDPDSLLIFIGNGNLFNTLIQENNNQNILFRGKVEHVQSYLNASDYYISASFTEGLPNSVLEALSCELPSLLSNIPSHIEITGNSYPYLFDPVNPDELTAKIKLILKNDTKEITQSLKHLIDKSFSTESMSKQYEEVYLELIKKANGKK